MNPSSPLVPGKPEAPLEGKPVTPEEEIPRAEEEVSQPPPSGAEEPVEEQGDKFVIEKSPTEKPSELKKPEEQKTDIGPADVSGESVNTTPQASRLQDEVNSLQE